MNQRRGLGQTALDDTNILSPAYLAPVAPETRREVIEVFPGATLRQMGLAA